MKRIRMVGVIGAIVTGAILSTVGATAASAAPAVVAVSVAGEVQRGMPAPASPLPGGTPTSPAPSGEVPNSRVNIGPVVNWIKKNAPSIISGMKSAVRGGINAFKKWWAGVAGWIRAGVTAVVNLTISELFNALWHYFFG